MISQVANHKEPCLKQSFQDGYEAELQNQETYRIFQSAKIKEKLSALVNPKFSVIKDSIQIEEHTKYNLQITKRIKKLTENLSHSCRWMYLIGGSNWGPPLRPFLPLPPFIEPFQARASFASWSRPTWEGFNSSTIAMQFMKKVNTIIRTLYKQHACIISNQTQHYTVPHKKFKYFNETLKQVQ